MAHKIRTDERELLTNSIERDGICYTFFHRRHFIGVAYLLILLARLLRLFVDGMTGARGIWWIDTALLMWTVLLLTALDRKKWGKLFYAELCVLSLTVFHTADLIIYFILSVRTDHLSWQHTAVTVLFTVFSVAPTIFFLWCDTHQHFPTARAIHAITFVRIAILLAESVLYVQELVHAQQEHRSVLVLSVALTLAGHILYEGALTHLVGKIHQMEKGHSAAEEPPRSPTVGGR